MSPTDPALAAEPDAPRRRLGPSVLLAVAASLAALEGYDLACYGVTVPSLLLDRGFAADKAAVGTVGSLVAIGMLVGAAACAATIRRLGSRRLLLTGAGLFSIGMLVCALVPQFVLFGAADSLSAWAWASCSPRSPPTSPTCPGPDAAAATSAS